MAVFEIADAPPDLRDLVAVIGQRQNQVAVRLRHGAAVPAVTFAAAPVGLLQQMVHVGVGFFEPGEQGRAEIPGNAVVIIADFGDPACAVLDAGGCIRFVTFERNALVPIVIRPRSLLLLNHFEPCIFPRRLIKMAVNTDKLV